MQTKINHAFTLMEIMITMVVISILMAASFPLITQFSVLKTGLDKNAIKCISNNNSGGWFNDTTGDTTIPASEPCKATVTDVQFDRGKAYNTAVWYAGIHGTSAQQIMAKKILRAACDQGGEKACDYFINTCWKYGSTTGTRCDDPANFLDISYYLHQNKNTSINIGATYINNQLKGLLPKMIPNLVAEVFYSAGTNQAPDPGSTYQNLNNNLAYDLAKPQIYIKACNNGDTSACIQAYNNNYNKSCTQVKTAWPEAVTGDYKLAYDSNGNSATVNCNMTSMASAAITGCNGITSDLLGNAPKDDCTYGNSNGYNQTCAVVNSNWTTAPSGTYKLTTNGAPPTALVPTSCNNNPPNHAACMASGVGAICNDGTVYAGDFGGKHLFITQTDESGTYSWNKGTAGISTGATNTINGQSNYNILIGLNNAESPYAAAQACRSLNNGPSNFGHTDWYLPAINELILLGTNKDAIGNLPMGAYSNYWSSTETSSSNATVSYGSLGTNTSSIEKSGQNLYVRCIRYDNSINASCLNIGNTCSDGTKYAGYYDSRYIFTTPLNETATYKWSNGSLVSYTDTGAIDVSDGKANWNKLITSTDTGAPYKAAEACKTLNNDPARNGGYTDWYLPAQNELLIIYNGKAAGKLPNFTTTNYWTSSQYSVIQGVSRIFTDGATSNIAKTVQYRVRCVRSE